MGKIGRFCISYWRQYRSVTRNEFRQIFTDSGVILVLVLALLRRGFRRLERGCGT